MTQRQAVAVPPICTSPRPTRTAPGRSVLRPRRTLLVGALLALGVSGAGAQEALGSGTAQTWEFGVLPTARKVASGVAGEHVWAGGLTFVTAYHARAGLALEAALVGASAPQLNFKTSAVVNDVSPSLSVVFRPPLGGRWRPYVSAGVAYQRFVIDEPPAGLNARTTFAATQAGVGVQYLLTSGLGWRSELNSQFGRNGSTVGGFSGLTFRMPDRRPSARPAPAPLVVHDTVRLVERVLSTDTVRIVDTVVARVTREVRGDDVILTLKDANFDFGKSTLRPEALPVLDGLAAELTTARADIRVAVVGHTDEIGTAAANRALGLARATAVRDYLILRGIVLSRIDVASGGEDYPIATNRTEAGRQLNRRVVIARAR